MNGVHDLGGTDGLGLVPVESDEPVWHADWEKAAFGMFSMPFRAGFFGVDQFRHGIEKMHPAAYLLSPYYEHWMHSVEHYGTAKGVFDAQEVERRTAHYLKHPDEPLPDTKDPEILSFVNAAVRHGAPARRESDAVAKFSVDDWVRVGDDSPHGHTRKARYVRGRTGVVLMAHGTFIYPDSAGNGNGDDPQHVYTIRFTNEELWGSDTAEPNGSVQFDVWEPYLTLADVAHGAAA